MSQIGASFDIYRIHSFLCFESLIHDPMLLRHCHDKIQHRRKNMMRAS